MSKRVLIFSTAYWPLIGGAELAVKELTDRLTDYEFDLITAKIDSKLKSEEKVGRVIIYRLGWGSSLDKLILAFYGGYFGAKLHRQNKYEAVWGVMASFAGLAAANCKKQTKLPFLLTLQEGDSLEEVESKMAPLWWKFKNIFTGANQIQVISNYLGMWAQKMGATSPITIIPNGVDLQTFYCDQDKLGSSTPTWELSSQVTIFTSSRLVKKNAVDIIIQALVELPSNFKLRIAGTGEEEEKLKNLAKSLEVEDRVEFLGNLTHQEIATELQQADVFTRPSRSEGLGNSFLEAMAAGVPVVATSVGGISDFLKHQETGFVCEVDNPESLAEQIKFITDPQNKAKVWQITNAARELVKQSYNWDTLAPQMAEIFSQLIV
ncbi:MAG: glycosyltransferase family 4 protein [bacterium]|nr:glycosyltransferase family 4 protein [bacterium]